MFVKTPTPDYIKTIFTMHALVGTKNHYTVDVRSNSFSLMVTNYGYTQLYS